MTITFTPAAERDTRWRRESAARRDATVIRTKAVDGAGRLGIVTPAGGVRVAAERVTYQDDVVFCRCQTADRSRRGGARSSRRRQDENGCAYAGAGAGSEPGVDDAGGAVLG